jgi:hypothetical protein
MKRHPSRRAPSTLVRQGQCHRLVLLTGLIRQGSDHVLTTCDHGHGITHGHLVDAHGPVPTEGPCAST